MRDATVKGLNLECARKVMKEGEEAGDERIDER